MQGSGIKQVRCVGLPVSHGRVLSAFIKPVLHNREKVPGRGVTGTYHSRWRWQERVSSVGSTRVQPSSPFLGATGQEWAGRAGHSHLMERRHQAAAPSGAMGTEPGQCPTAPDGPLVFAGSSPADVEHARIFWNSATLPPPLESSLGPANLRREGNLPLRGACTPMGEPCPLVGPNPMRDTAPWGTQPHEGALPAAPIPWVCAFSSPTHKHPAPHTYPRAPCPP